MAEKGEKIVTDQSENSTESHANAAELNRLKSSLSEESLYKDDPDYKMLINSPMNIGDYPKKKSAFQITSVKPAQNENDGDSMDDLDESHAEDASSLDWSKTTDVDHDPSSDDTLSNVNEDVNSKPVEDVNQNKEKESSTRFRVVKLESEVPFHKGRWKCFDSLKLPPEEEKKNEREKEVGSANSSAANSIHYVHGEDDPSKNPLIDGTVTEGNQQANVQVPGIQEMSNQEPVQKQQQQFAGHNSSVITQGVPTASAEYQANQNTNQNTPVAQSAPQQTNQGALSVSNAAPNQIQFAQNTQPTPVSHGQSAGQNAQTVTQNIAHSQQQQPTSNPSLQRQMSTQQQQQQQPSQVIPVDPSSNQQQPQTQLPQQPTQLPQQQTQQPLPSTSNGQSSIAVAPSEFNSGANVPQATLPAPSNPSNLPSGTSSVQPPPQSHPASSTNINVGAGGLPGAPTTRESTPTLGGSTAQNATDNSNTPATNNLSANQNSEAASSKAEEDTKPNAKSSTQSKVPTVQVSASSPPEPPSSRDSSDMSSVASVLMESLQGISPQPGSPTGKQDSAEGAEGTGSSTVAIDNKIEAAMDLVKSHLMSAVREEVEVLKEQIKDLVETNKQLLAENQVLRQTAPPEVVASIPQVTPEEPPTSTS